MVFPDTSPRGANIAGEDDAYDFGTGAGFYVDATQAPWDAHYNMYTYITKELPALVEANLPTNGLRSITGHSMGGHGALTIAFKNPSMYASVSAFAPICNPSQVPWGKKALGGYLGPDESTWKQYDACELLRAHGVFKEFGDILVDQGLADNFLGDQLKPETLESAAKEAGQPLTVRRHA